MKNLITAAAGLMLLLAFLLQFTHSQVLHGRMTRADQAITTFREVIRQEGCISAENEAWLKETLAGILGCSEEMVYVTGDRRPVFRGSKVEYQVKAPLEKAVITADFFGIEEEKNRLTYRAEGATTSEYTGRQP